MMNQVSYIWPKMLWLLVLVPMLVLFYWWILKRKRKVALRYSNLAMVRSAMQGASSWRRHVPPALFLLGLATLLFASARPSAIVTLPNQTKTVILAMDVSGSMRATDVSPTRISASQEAARVFVTDLPGNTRIGVVAFAGTAMLVQPPTENREEVLGAIDRFQLQRGTAVGNAIVVSLQTLFPDQDIDIKGMAPRGGDSAPRETFGGPLPKKDKAPFKSVPPGSYGSASIVLLSDGQTTTGADPLEAAKLAAERGVKIYTVGFGTPNGEIMLDSGWRMRVRLDEETLKQIAGMTVGEYFYAASGSDLKQVYDALNSRLVLERKESEVTAVFALGAALLMALAGGLSLLWFNRLL
jgi:Ca-activated chloride channel family protein